MGSVLNGLFALQRSSWLVTEAAGQGPSGHPSLEAQVPRFFPRREGLGRAPPNPFLTGTLDWGGWG